MSQDYPKPYDIANTLYHGAILTALAGGYAMIGKKLIKFDVGDPSKDYEAVLKLAAPVMLATITRDWLIAHNIIPPDIPKNLDY
jgi:hypothetical protein